MAVTEALTRAGTGAVTEGSDVAEADAFAATAAAFADAGEAETARAERVADRIAPHVAASGERVVAARLFTSPRCRRGVGIAARADVDEADHAELLRFLHRRLAGDVRIRVVLRTLDAVALVHGVGVGVTHGTLFTLRARTGAALGLLGVVVRRLLGLLLFELALGGSVQHLLHQKKLIAIDRLGVVAVHLRHEERHRGDDADVEEERKADEHVRSRLEAREGADGRCLAGVDGAHLERDARALELHARLRVGREIELVTAAHLGRRPRATGLNEIVERERSLARNFDRAARAREHDERDADAAGDDDRRARGTKNLARDEVVAAERLLADEEALRRALVRDVQRVLVPLDEDLDRSRMTLDLIGVDVRAALDHRVRERLVRIEV